MNDLVLSGKGSHEQTMSSREIAELTGKRHADVVRDIKNMCDELEIDVSSFAHIYLDSINREQTEYLLNRELVQTLITGYSIKLRYAVIRRLDDLEKRVRQNVAAIPNFTDPAAAAIAWAAEYTAKKTAQDQLALAAPKAEALDLISDAEGLFGVREAAKTLKIKQNELTTMLVDRGWMYRDSRNVLQGYATHIERGYVKHIMSKPIEDNVGQEHVYSSAKITAKGIARLAQLLKAAFK